MSPMVFHPVVLTSGRVRQTVPTTTTGMNSLLWFLLSKPLSCHSKTKLCLKGQADQIDRARSEQGEGFSSFSVQPVAFFSRLSSFAAARPPHLTRNLLVAASPSSTRAAHVLARERFPCYKGERGWRALWKKRWTVGREREKRAGKKRNRYRLLSPLSLFCHPTALRLAP